MSIVISILLILLALLSYRQQLHPKGGWGLLALRLVVLGILIFILLGTVLSFAWQERPGRVVLLLDRSLSMKAIGADSAVLATAEKIRLNLPERFQLELWNLGESAVKGVSVQFAERTEIGRALELVTKTKPAAIFLLSDGQDNGAQEPVGVVRESGVPVYAIGFGADEARNLRLTEIELPDKVYVGDTVKMRVRLLSVGGRLNEQARLAVDGQFRQLVLGPGVIEQEVEFSLIFNQPGRREVHFKLESLPDEVSYLDNQQTRVLDVQPARKSCIYITNRPGVGTRFILNAVRKNPRLAVKEVVALSGNLSIPGDPDKFRLYILDGVDGTVESENLWRGLRQRVEAGAGVLLVAGPDFKPAGELSRLMPIVEWQRLTGSFTTIPGDDRMDWVGMKTGEINPNELPPFTMMISGKPREDATVWLEAAENGLPLLVSMRFGLGRVVYLAGYPFWRWGFGSGFLVGKETPLDFLLKQIIGYLTETDTVLFKLDSEAGAYMSGEPIRLKLRARKQTGDFWEGLDVRVAVDSGGLWVPMRERGQGVYEATVLGAGPGEHYAVAEVRSGEQFLGQSRVEFFITEQSVELTRLGLNRLLLRRLAEVNGGWFVRAESLNPADVGNINVKVYQRRVVLDPRNSPWWFAVMAVLLGLEIILRRRRGLY